MESLLSLAVVCAVVLLIGWLYAEAADLLKRRRTKHKETGKTPLPWSEDSPNP